LVSLSYTEVRQRRAIWAARRVNTGKARGNWTLIVALGLNALAWGAILVLLPQLH
jgi:hypothetical protein